jgi:hypothetical protein
MLPGTEVSLHPVEIVDAGVPSAPQRAFLAMPKAPERGRETPFSPHPALCTAFMYVHIDLSVLE